jgi:hypothetical protein
MRYRLIGYCAGIALSMPGAAIGDTPTHAGSISRCVVESLRVDGLPVVQHGWCRFDEDQGLWVPLSADLARTRIFGIRPVED